MSTTSQLTELSPIPDLPTDGVAGVLLEPSEAASKLEPARAQSISHLAEKRYVTVVVRLLIDQRQRLVYGEVVNAAGESGGWFAGWRGLIRTTRDYLTKHPR